MKKYFSEAKEGFIAITIYMVLMICQTVPFKLVGLDVATLNNTMKSVYLIIYDILIMSSIALVYRKLLVEKIKDMKKNHKKYYKENFKYYLLGFLGMIVSNGIIILGLEKGMSANEAAVRDLFKTFPIYLYLSAVIFAPFVEELIFRQSLKKIVTNKNVFIIISGLLFGYMHLSGKITGPTDLLYIIPYGSLGCAFAYILNKTDNILTTMGLHFMHNGIILNLQLLLMLI